MKLYNLISTFKFIFLGLYQQGVTASHDAKTQACAALGDVYGGLTAGDDGTGRRVAGQSGGSGRATLILNGEGGGSEVQWKRTRLVSNVSQT